METEATPRRITREDTMQTFMANWEYARSLRPKRESIVSKISTVVIELVNSPQVAWAALNGDMSTPNPSSIESHGQKEEI